MVADDPALGNDGVLMSPLDRDYLEALLKLGYREDARKKLEELYKSRKSQMNRLFTEEERAVFEKLLKEGKEREAEEFLDLAYERKTKVDETGLRPLDRAYIRALEDLGEKEEAKRLAKELSNVNGNGAVTGLLDAVQREYVDELMRLGRREKARKVIDEAYLTRKKKEHEIMLSLFERARKC